MPKKPPQPRSIPAFANTAKAPLSPSVTRRAEAKAATREKILVAAREFFIAEGFEAVSMRRIADAIGYTPAAIYVHFKDKTELLITLGDRDFRFFHSKFRAIEAIPDPVDRLRAAGSAYINFALQHPRHYKLMFMTKWPIIDPLQCPLEHGNVDEDSYAFLDSIVTDCIKAGRFGDGYRDHRIVTQVCWGAVHGVVSLHITHGEDPWCDFTNPKETASLLLDACIAGMLAPVTRPPAASRNGARKP